MYKHIGMMAAIVRELARIQNINLETGERGETGSKRQRRECHSVGRWVHLHFCADVGGRWLPKQAY